MKFLKSLSIITLITLITQIFLLVRTMFMANSFGVSEEMDAFNLANVLTISIMSIISAAVTTVLIPILTNYNNTTLEEKESINTFVSIVSIVSIVIVLLLYILGKPFVNLFTTNFNPEIQDLTFKLILILSISQVFKIYTGLSTAYLQTEDDFYSPKVAALYASILSLGYFLLVKDPSVYGITIVIGISFIAEAIYIFIKQQKLKVKINFKLKIYNPTYKKLLKSTFPIILSSAAFQLSLLVSNFIISFYGVGYVSILGYATQIVNIFHALLILNIIMILYPSIARKFAGNIQDAKKTIVNYVNITNMIVIPIVFGYIATGDLIIKILLQRGEFNEANTLQVYLMSSLLFLAFPFNTFRDYMYRSFYSLSDTITPSRNSLFIVFITVILIIVLLPIVKVYSVAVGPVVASIISALLSYSKLKQKIGLIDVDSQIIKNNLLFSLNSIVMCIVLIFIKIFLISNLNNILQLILLVLIGISIFFTLLFFNQNKFITNILKILNMKNRR